jgi:hypothetical protein
VSFLSFCKGKASEPFVGIPNLNSSTKNLNGSETNDNSIEDVDPTSGLGGRKNKGGPADLIPKGQAEDIAAKAGEKGAKAVDEKKNSLKIRIDLNLNVHVTLDAHIDGWVEIGLL